MRSVLDVERRITEGTVSCQDDTQLNVKTTYTYCIYTRPIQATRTAFKYRPGDCETTRSSLAASCRPSPAAVLEGTACAAAAAGT